MRNAAGLGDVYKTTSWWDRQISTIVKLCVWHHFVSWNSNCVSWSTVSVEFHQVKHVCAGLCVFVCRFFLAAGYGKKGPWVSLKSTIFCILIFIYHPNILFLRNKHIVFSIEISKVPFFLWFDEDTSPPSRTLHRARDLTKCITGT